MSEKILKVVESLIAAKEALDDDFSDKLSSRYTVFLLIGFATLNQLAVLVGSAIKCWAPKHFAGSHIKYTNNYCWVRNTYYLPWDEEVPQGGDDTPRQTITYYQWIPFILLFQVIHTTIPGNSYYSFR